MSVLFKAVKDNNLNLLKQALAENPDADDLAGALRNAAETGRNELVECLLDAGARNDWAIVAAASFAQVETVRLLYGRGGGQLNAALIGAAAHGRTETVRFLLTTPADSLDEALADAALRGYLEIAALLLEKGADPRAAVYGDQTARDLALKNDRSEIIDLFRRHAV